MKPLTLYILHISIVCFSFIMLGCSSVLSQSNIEIQPWGSSYNQPIDMTPWMDDDFILIEKSGKVKTIDQDGRLLNTILDIKNHIKNDGGERGLLGIALHPAFPDSPFLYLNHTDENNNTAVVRYVFDPASTNVDPSSRKVLLTVGQPYSNHNGGCIRFGPDGYLYIGMGDGGSAGDPENRAQNLLSLLGKMLRIDVNQGDPYAIPEDNPFKDIDNAQPEIWSYGWRNPWRFSFDRETGDMWVGDVGQNAIEEISFEPAGAKGGLNYGWRCYEGDETYNQNGDCNGPFVDPVITRKHSSGDRSITGGYRYRGPQAGLVSRYIFGDYVSGNIYIASVSNDTIPELDSLSTAGKINSIASFAEDKAGRLYGLSLSGQIYKIFLKCDISTPELQMQSTGRYAIGVENDSLFNQYIWYYHKNSDQKQDFVAIDTINSALLYDIEDGNYYVTAIDSNDCRADSEILNVLISSVNPVDFYNIKVFPNPASNHLTIATERALPQTKIEIRNSKGQLIRALESSLPGTFSLVNLPGGVYFLKFIAGQKYFVTKIMKE